MFRTATNVAIGNNITNLLKTKGLNQRQFAIEYLKKRDGNVNADDIQKMQNRINRIVKGIKGVQIEDLPIFAEILEVSIENILSAGTEIAPSTERMSNYRIAYSNDPAIWEAYIKRDDNPFLNPDEFNKTVIDYAMEAGNYPLLKYLVDNDYIWFVGDDPKEYYMGFGAGTSIERRDFMHEDLLNWQLKEKDDLRFKMISLALDNKDFEMLDYLHAREIPLLYEADAFGNFLRDKKLPESDNVNAMIKSIASCPNTVLNYFFSEFKIDPSPRLMDNTFVFPYAGKVLDAMIKKKHKSTSIFLEKIAAYNKSVEKQLLKIIDEYTDVYKNKMGIDEELAEKESWHGYSFYPDVDFICCWGLFPKDAEPNRRLCTNIVRIAAKSSDTEIQFLIDEINTTYDHFNDYLKRKDSVQ